MCEAPWNRSSTLSSNDTYAEVPSAQCQCEESASDISREKGGAIAPPFSSRNLHGKHLMKKPFLPLFPSSAIFSFSPFFPPHSDVTRMLGSLSKGAVVCAECLGFPGGSHLFRIGTSHPFLGIAHRVSNPNPDSMGYPVGFWGSLGVSRVF